MPGVEEVSLILDQFLMQIFGLIFLYHGDCINPYPTSAGGMVLGFSFLRDNLFPTSAKALDK